MACSMPHKAMSRRGKLKCPSCGADIGKLEKKVEEAVLDAKARKALPDSAFALPGRRYPIHDESHARNALARAAGKPEEAQVKAAVRKRYPNIGKPQEGRGPRWVEREDGERVIEEGLKGRAGGAPRFDPKLHPRDREGQFRAVPGVGIAKGKWQVEGGSGRSLPMSKKDAEKRARELNAHPQFDPAGKDPFRAKPEPPPPTRHGGDANPGVVPYSRGAGVKTRGERVDGPGPVDITTGWQRDEIRREPRIYAATDTLPYASGEGYIARYTNVNGEKAQIALYIEDDVNDAGEEIHVLRRNEQRWNPPEGVDVEIDAFGTPWFMLPGGKPQELEPSGHDDWPIDVFTSRNEAEDAMADEARDLRQPPASLSGEPVGAEGRAKANPAQAKLFEGRVRWVEREDGSRAVLREALPDLSADWAGLGEAADAEIHRATIAFMREREYEKLEESAPPLPHRDTNPKSNWVEKSGGLPSYIDRIARHLHEKGRPVGQAIAIAVNVVKKMCATGDVNFPGVQQVNAKSRAEACAAVADWERKKAGK